MNECSPQNLEGPISLLYLSELSCHQTAEIKATRYPQYHGFRIMDTKVPPNGLLTLPESIFYVCVQLTIEYEMQKTPGRKVYIKDYIFLTYLDLSHR